MRASLVACTVVVSSLAAPGAVAEGAGSCEGCSGDASFAGLYAGVNLGVVSHRAERNDLDGFFTDNSGWSTVSTGLAGGAQVGYDWGCCSRVLGLIADWSWTDVSEEIADNPNVMGVDNVVESGLDSFYSLRARAGLALDDALVFVSVGPAAAKFETVWRDAAVSFSDSDSRWGWTGSVGTEFRFSGKLSAGAELYYMHFDEEVTTFTDIVPFAFGSSDSMTGGRILVNYRFGG